MSDKNGFYLIRNTDQARCPACRAEPGDGHVEGCRKVMFDQMKQQQEGS